MRIEDPNITFINILNPKTHELILGRLDYPAPTCPHCFGKMAKYDFQKVSRLPYPEISGYKTFIKDWDTILNTMELPCFNTKVEAPITSSRLSNEMLLFFTTSTTLKPAFLFLSYYSFHILIKAVFRKRLFTRKAVFQLNFMI